MTDNRTTELHKLLDERGVEWKTDLYPSTLSSNEQLIDTHWQAENAEWRFTERPDGRTYLSLIGIWPDCTPEQAIAATLGRPKAKSHPYGYERDTGAYDCTRCECGCINDISATYCNDCGGEIEIDESAEKEYYDGYSKHTVFAKKHDDGSLEFRERRYIPEDAATQGSGTLTAEQVRKCVRVGACDHGLWGALDEDTDWQVIADELNAELGSERIAELEAENERLRKAGYEIGYHDAMKAAKRGGTLTAEQVMAIAGKHQPDYCSDTHVCFDWQAIADELNAEMGSETCELVYGENDYGDDGWWCQSCGEWFAASFRHTGRNNIIKPSYCQHCGKVVGE